MSAPLRDPSQARCLTPAVERVMAWHRQKLPFPMPTPEDEPARDLHRQGAEDAALRGEENELLGDSSASSAPLR
jgi:hypothetical protein